MHRWQCTEILDALCRHHVAYLDLSNIEIAVLLANLLSNMSKLILSWPTKS